MGEFVYQEFLNLDVNDVWNECIWKIFVFGDFNQVMVGLELFGDFIKYVIIGVLIFFKQYYDEVIRVLEKEVWVCKVLELLFLSIVKFLDFFGDLKCIYVYRNVFDIIRFQKSVGLIESYIQFVDVYMKWVENIKVIVVLVKSGF